jgi:hypothetical protein
MVIHIGVAYIYISVSWKAWLWTAASRYRQGSSSPWCSARRYVTKSSSCPSLCRLWPKMGAVRGKEEEGEEEEMRTSGKGAQATYARAHKRSQKLVIHHRPVVTTGLGMGDT